MPKLISKTISNKIGLGFFYLILFLLSFGQIARFSFGEYPIYMYIYELLLVIFVFFLSVNSDLNKLFTANKGISILLSWLVIDLVISSFFYTGFENLVAVLYTLRLSVYFVYFLLIQNFLQKVKAGKKSWNIGIIFFTFITIIFSFVQYFLYPNIGNLAYLGWDPHLYRMVGLFFEPQLAVAIYGLLFLYIYYLNHFARNQKIFLPPSNYLDHSYNGSSGRLRVAAKILVTSLRLILIVLSVMIFLTVSRGGIIAFVITLLFIFRRKLKLIILSLLIVTAIFIAIPKPQSEGLNIFRTSSIQTRLIDYGKALKIWQKSPIMGIGYNHIRFEKDRLEENILTEKYNPSHASSSFHSSFLIILVTTGIVGLTIYLWVLWNLARINVFSKYVTIFLVLASIFDNVLLHPMVMFLYLSMIALSQITHPSRESR